MKYPDLFFSYNSSRGSLFIDLIIAIAFGTFFIGLISSNSFFIKDVYYDTKSRLSLLKIHDLNNKLFNTISPNQTIIGTSSVVSNKLYGNNLFEITSNNGPDLMIFDLIRSIFFDNNIPIGVEPVCSVDFSNKEVVGSYNFFKNKFNIKSETDFNVKIAQINLPIDPSLFLTDLEVRNGIAYVSVDSNIVSDPDFIIFDIKDSEQPKLISSINTGPGLNSFVLAGKRIFSSASSKEYTFHTILLNDLANPILENRYKLPLPYATATPPFGSAISYKDGFVYLGTEKWDSEEFNIIDVSNVLLPTKVGGIEIGSKINNILINQNSIYVTGSNDKQLSIIEITSSGPNLKKYFDPSGWERQEGKSLSFFENRLDFGRSSGGFDIVGDHEFFSFSTTSTTTLNNYFSLNKPGGIYGIVRDRSFVYIATKQLNKEFEIYNSDLSKIIKSISLPIFPKLMTCDHDFLYILANHSPFIYKISIESINKK